MNSITYIYAIVFILIVGSTAFWLMQMRKRAERLRKSVYVLYAAFSLSYVGVSMLLTEVCMEGIPDYTSMRFPDLSVLFLYPIQYLLFRVVKDHRSPSIRTYHIVLLPPILYALLTVTMCLAIDKQTLQETPWMWFALTSFYNVMIFVNVVVSSIMFTVHYFRYKREMRSYFSDFSKTDFSCVKGMTTNMIVSCLLAYLMLTFRLNSFPENYVLTFGLVMATLVATNLQGYYLCQFKGVKVPDAVDWSRDSLSLQEIEEFEQYYKETDDASKMKNATLNISDTIEAWANSPQKYYLRQGISINEVADQMNVPANLLSSFLNKTQMTNFNQWINGFRIEHAKKLILQTNMTHDEIAAACGFANRSQMSRVFKTREGITPTEFKAAQ